MKGKSGIKRLLILVLIVLGCGMFFTTPVRAGAKVVTIEGVSYDVNAAVRDNLKSLVGKKIKVMLVSGSTVSGLVKDVGNHLVHVEKLDGSNFFDALIRIDNITAISTQFRQFKR